MNYIKSSNIKAKKCYSFLLEINKTKKCYYISNKCIEKKWKNSNIRYILVFWFCDSMESE